MEHWRLAVGALTKTRGLIFFEREMLQGEGLHPAWNVRCSWLDFCIGCVFLQVGCTTESERAFQCAIKWVQPTAAAIVKGTATPHFASPSKSTSSHVSYGAHLRPASKCLIMFARRGYSRVMCNLDGISPVDVEPKRAQMASEFINNQAICALYLCDLEWAICLLESAIWEAPNSHFSEATVFNLCTLYDLSSSNKLAVKLKKKLQHLKLSLLLN